jgi:hypothetical protein
MAAARSMHCCEEGIWRAGGYDSSFAKKTSNGDIFPVKGRQGKQLVPIGQYF